MVIENKHFNMISIAVNVRIAITVMYLREDITITAVNFKILCDYGSIKGSWKQDDNYSIVQCFEGYSYVKSCY